MTQASPRHVAFSETIRRAPLPQPNLPALAPLLRKAGAAATEPAKRSRIWEFDGSLHCSIIGTCLSTAELRQILKKLGLASPESTDHALHGAAVSLAARHDQAAKLLNKALDRRHHLPISQFAKARTEPEVVALWRGAVARGEIPGAYWATLTHPATTRALIREAFGEVHMLSHLVGAANRADIRRLRELESLQAALQAKLERQQAAFRDAVTERERSIRDLREALAGQMRSSSRQESAAGGQTAAVDGLIADLERRMNAEKSRRLSSDERLAAARAQWSRECERERERRVAAEAQNRALGTELAALETLLGPPPDDGPPEPPPRLDGIAVLYVGGRSAQIAHLRALGARLGAHLLHHDGGKEQHPDLLGGLVSRADFVLFPVDCVSHDAALSVKRLCRQAGRPFLPLRSASVASFAAALAQVSASGAPQSGAPQSVRPPIRRPPIRRPPIRRPATSCLAAGVMQRREVLPCDRNALRLDRPIARDDGPPRFGQAGPTPAHAPGGRFHHGRAQAPVQLLDQRPGPAIGNPQRAPGRRDRPGPGDRFQHRDLAGADPAAIGEVDADAQRVAGFRAHARL